MNEQCAIDFCCNRIKDFRPSFLKIIEKNTAGLGNFSAVGEKNETEDESKLTER